MIKIEGLDPNLKTNIFAKLETVNPSGSIKDRMAKYLFQKAEKNGELRPGYTVIEATSGNTGVSFAMMAAIKNYKMIAVMPENTSKQKIDLIKFFGAKIILTPAQKQLLGSIEMTRKLFNKYKNVWLPKQFENPDNVESYKNGFGKEIIYQASEQLSGCNSGNINIFVTGIGTGGTLTGTAKSLKEKFPKIKIFGVEAAERFHQIEGISDGIRPKILDYNLIDGIIKIKSQEAMDMVKWLAQKKGLFVGISSGANIAAAIKLTKKYNPKNIITVFPDRGERYLLKFL